MRLLKNRVFAWCVLAVVILLSLSLSGGGALKDLRLETESVFYNGVNADGLCIDRDLKARTEATYNLLTIAKNYSIDKALIDAADKARQQTVSGAIGARYQANAHLTQTVEDLYTALENVSLSETDKSFAYNQYKEFKSRAETISRDPYNQRAEAFNANLWQYPAKFVASLSGIEPLELFR